MKSSILFFVVLTFFEINGCIKWTYNKITPYQKKTQLLSVHKEKNLSLISCANIDSLERLILNYDTPVFLNQDQAAYCDLTYQTTSVLNIQNHSMEFPASIFVNATNGIDEARIYEIPSNSITPIRILNNWNGAVLKVANVSAENAVIKITLF